jgi:hypothetical protein
LNFLPLDDVVSIGSKLHNREVRSMSIDWLLANAEGEDAASNGDWRAAERHFRRAVQLSASEEPMVRIVSMLDHALVLCQMGDIYESERVAAHVRVLAGKHLDLQSVHFSTVVAMCDTCSQYQESIEVRRLFLNKIMGKLRSQQSN